VHAESIDLRLLFPVLVCEASRAIGRLFRKMSYSLGFPFSLQTNFSSGSLRLFSPKSN